MESFACQSRTGYGRRRWDDAALCHFQLSGTIVFANTAAANRDPSIYENPDAVDITRTGLPPILTLSAGMDYRLGANLARLELAEAFKVITAQNPTPPRTGPAPWKPFIGLSGPQSLPIAFDP
jgi:cytochrome P450